MEKERPRMIYYVIGRKFDTYSMAEAFARQQAVEKSAPVTVIEQTKDNRRRKVFVADPRRIYFECQDGCSP